MASPRAQILISAVDDTRRAFTSVNGSLSHLREHANQLGDLLSRLGGLIGLGLGVRELTETADQYKNLQARLKLAVTSQEEFNRADAELYAISQRNRAPLAETVTLYARLAPSVRALGREQSEALAVTETISQAVALSGASSEAAAGALLQLGQAFASGQLRGEEFNAVVEQTPRLAQAIADGMGVPMGALRALAQEGKITAKAVMDALKHEKARLTLEMASLPDTVSGALVRLKNAFLRAFGERDSHSGVTAALAQSLQFLAQHLEALIDLAGVALVAAIGRMVASLMASLAATRAENAARLASLKILSAEAAARHQSALAALAQARAQGVATAALVTDVAKTRTQAMAASSAFAQAAASATLWGRVLTVLRGALALLGGPVGALVTALGVAAGMLYSARDATVQFGGKTATLKQIATATWDLVTEKIGAAIDAIAELASVGEISWRRLREAADSELRELGATLRRSVNTLLGAFTAVGRVAGVTAGFLVARFRSAFSDIGALASALAKDVEAAFQGDFSMQTLKTTMMRQLGEVGDYGRQVSRELHEAFSRDYVGEATQAIASRIKPETTEPGVFGRTQPAAAALGAEGARLTLNQARADAELRLLKDSLARENAELDRALAERQLSLREYYAEKTQLAQRDIDANIERVRTAIQRQKALLKTSQDVAGRAKAQADLVKLEAELTLLNRQRTDAEVANARQAAQAEKELGDELARVKAELRELTGVANNADRRAQVAQRYQSLVARLQAEGDQEGAALVNRLIDVQAAEADLAAWEQRFNQTLTNMNAAEQAIQLQRQAGQLGEAQAQRELLALHQATGEALTSMLPKLEAAASAIGPDALARVQAWKNEITRVNQVVDEVAVSFDGSLRDGMANLFESVGSGAKSASAAFADFGRSVLGTIQRMASQKLAESLFGGLFGSVGSASGPGAMLSSLFKGFAQGGYVSGPGTSTSDSIPARLSAGEFVVNAAAVRRVGVGLLHSINGLSAGPRLLGGALGFASGGLVPTGARPSASAAAGTPGANGGSAVRIVNVVDPAMAADYLTSSSGEKTILNILQRNAGAVRQLLS
ncbi:tape measure protein [Hahella aquimaris]|uniref:tape measure protein n=1 Tax=Hahella sp. HNIBRBA332 TaxID=3015983 RepID=UPI00273B046E|nr:tape measure protein [Hahella sp. HNIBRBA332]WLQ14282.1 tape measure protein [Hahella sp. HNIBRBA332]